MGYTEIKQNILENLSVKYGETVTVNHIDNTVMFTKAIGFAIATMRIPDTILN